jgi:hypothetical protein
LGYHIENTIRWLWRRKLIKNFAGIDVSSSEARDVQARFPDNRWHIGERLCGNSACASQLLIILKIFSLDEQNLRA